MDLFDLIEKLFEHVMNSFSHTTRDENSATPPARVNTPNEEQVPVHHGTTETKKMHLTLEQLKKVMPNLSQTKAAEYHPFITTALDEFEINTPLRVSAFIAQLAHESAQLRYFEEIASGEAYEGRKDLGNVFPGDGKRYKGRGPIQLTGRSNYRDYGKELGIDLENSPEIAATPSIGFRIAGAFWKRKGLNQLADVGEFRKISIKINGINKKTGEPNGLADRIKYYTVAKEALGAV